jgi:hypothetical protein
MPFILDFERTWWGRFFWKRIVHTKLYIYLIISNLKYTRSGAILDFKLGGRTSNNCTERREARKCLGYFVWKITILLQKIIFFPILGGRAPGAPPPPRLDSPLQITEKKNIDVEGWAVLLVDLIVALLDEDTIYLVGSLLHLSICVVHYHHCEMFRSWRFQ